MKPFRLRHLAIAATISAATVTSMLAISTLGSNPAQAKPAALVPTTVSTVAPPTTTSLVTNVSIAPTTTAVKPAPTPHLTFAAAAKIVKTKGYRADQGASVWDSSATLNAIWATPLGAADGGGQRAFFFSGDKYVGTDTIDGSSGLGLHRINSTNIQASYEIYADGDPECCPTGGSKNVDFKWSGAAVASTSAIPTSKQRS